MVELSDARQARRMSEVKHELPTGTNRQDHLAIGRTAQWSPCGASICQPMRAMDRTMADARLGPRDGSLDGGGGATHTKFSGGLGRWQ